MKSLKKGLNGMKSEAVVASLSLHIDTKGRLILENRDIPINTIKVLLSNSLPDWDHLEATVNSIRWVTDNIKILNDKIIGEFGEDESICLQKRNVRSKGKARINKEIQ